jgi:hypothetical protein
MDGDWTFVGDIDISGNPPYYYVIDGPDGMSVSVKVERYRHSTGERRFAEWLTEHLNRNLSSDMLADIMDTAT